jgi:hypothetical protein
MNLNFPSPAYSGDTYQYGSSPTYIYDGVYWNITYYGVDGVSADHWRNGDEIMISSGQIMTIGSDYMLIDSSLLTEAETNDGFGSSVTIAGKTYSRDGKLSVFGDFVVSDSDILNNGQIKVEGGLILDGNTNIIGNGIII